MTNLRDARILNNFSVAIRGVQKLGQIPSFTPPDIDIETEDFRGAGMDGTVEIPMGVNKIEFSFDMFTWDDQIWTELGFGAGSMDVPISFYGYYMTPAGAEGKVIIDTKSLIKSIKTGAIEPGKQVKISVGLSCNFYSHTIDTQVVTMIDVFNKEFIINGVDRSSKARTILGYTY